MKVNIVHRPSYAMAIIDLASGEEAMSEGGAMVSMTGNVNLQTIRMKAKRGGILGAVKQLLAGESFLVNKITCQGGEGHVTVAPTHVGDIERHELSGGSDLMIQSGSFLASDPGITLDGEWSGARSFFAGEGLFMLKASGAGTILMNAFGGIDVHDIDGSFIVDTGHIVAFESTLQYKVTKFGGGWMAALMSGEGLVARFEGKGRLYTQTRNLQEFGRLIGPLLPPRRG